jgi:hypothetical protein
MDPYREVEFKFYSTLNDLPELYGYMRLHQLKQVAVSYMEDGRICVIAKGVFEKIAYPRNS